MRRSALAALMLAGSLALPAVANAAQTYPEPKDPGKVAPKPKGPFHTYTVCKKKSCKFHKIQAAVDKAKAGDKIRVKNGVYKESVTVSGRKKRFLRLVGNRKKPGKVILDGQNKKSRQNGIFINGADGVTVDGFKARDYAANGFFAVNVVGYKMTHLIAEHTGVYGIYAFNSKGGEMSHSEAYYNNDAGYYIGQTPQQTKPIRSIVKDVDSWGNALGWSGTNMRYVTITKSRFYNNAAGIVPNALDSEKYPPAEDNVISDNDIFWNNFDFHKGAPFKIREDGTAALIPVGTGVVLLGGHRNRVENNRIFGNFLAGVVAVEGILLAKPENQVARALEGNQVQGNTFGVGDIDLNGRELVTDGNGTNNCWGPNTGVRVTQPADPAFFPACPFQGANPFSQDVQNQLLGMAGEAAVQSWTRSEHSKQGNIKPLEVFTKK
jgi:hypothetical protein